MLNDTKKRAAAVASEVHSCMHFFFFFFSRAHSLRLGAKRRLSAPLPSNIKAGSDASNTKRRAQSSGRASYYSSTSPRPGEREATDSQSRCRQRGQKMDGWKREQARRGRNPLGCTSTPSLSRLTKLRDPSGLLGAPPILLRTAVDTSTISLKLGRLRGSSLQQPTISSLQGHPLEESTDENKQWRVSSSSSSGGISISSSCSSTTSKAVLAVLAAAAAAAAVTAVATIPAVVTAATEEAARQRCQWQQDQHQQPQ